MEFKQGDETQTITFTEVSPGSMYDGFFGANVSWETDDGWVVRIFAYDSDAFGGPTMPGLLEADVTVERIDGHDYWTAGTYTGFGAGHTCTVEISELSAEKVAGQATCPRLRWTDGVNPSYEPTYIDGQEPFDVTITFEAESTPPPTGTTS